MGSPAPSRGGASASPPPATRVDVHVHLRAFANLDLLERGWYAVRCVALNGDDARRSFALVDATPVGRPRPAARREKVPSCGGDVGDDDDALASGAPPLGEVLEGARWGDARARARASSADASDVAPGRYTTRAFPVMYARESFPVDRLVRFATRVAAEREDEEEEEDDAAGSAPARTPPRAKPGTPRSPSVPSTVALEFELLRAPIPDDADADGPGPAPSRAAMRVVARRRADVVVQRAATSEAEGEESEGARPAEQLGGPGSRSATAPFVDYAYLPLLFDEAHLAQCECAVAAFARVATPGTAASLGEEEDVASSASGDGSLDSAIYKSSSRRRAARAFSFTALRAAWVSARREEWAPWRVRVASRGADAELAALRRDPDRGGSRGGGGVLGFGLEKQRGAANGSEGGPPKDPNPGDASDAFACVVGDADASASSASASSASPSAEDESSRPVRGLEGATREAKARRRRMRDGERDEKKASAFGAFFGAFRSGVGTATDSRREDAYRVGGGGASEAPGGSSRSRLAALASRLGGGLGGSDSDSRGGFRRFQAVFEDDLHGAPWDVPIFATEVVVGEAAKDETLSRSAVDPAELAVSPEEGEEEPEDGVGGSKGAGGGGVLGCSPGGESSANPSANPSADPPDPPDPAEVERAERTSRRRGRLSARGAVRGSGAPNGLATSEPRARRTATEETDDASESSSSESSSESSPPSPHLVVLVHGFDGSLQDLRLVRAHLALVAPHATCVVSASNRGRTSTSSVAEMGARLAEETARAAKEAFDERFPFHEDEVGTAAGTAASVVSSSPRALPRVRVSFAAHSLGCLIVRAALAHPAMAPFLDALHFFLSISGPHLGYASPICTARCVPVSGRERSCSPLGGSSRALSVSCSPFALGLRALRRLRPRATCLREAALADATRAEDCYLYRLAREPRGLALFRHVVLCSSPQDGYVERESARVEARAEEEEEEEEEEEASRAPTKSGKSRGDDARRKSRKRLFRARREMALAMLEPVLAKARAPAPGEMDHPGEEAGVSSASRGASRGFRTTLARVDVLFPPGKGASLASCVGRKAHIDFLETQEWVRFVLWGHREKFT